MATPSIPVQDTPRVEVDLIHAAAAVWLGLDAEDALRALVLHETQGIVGGVRIEELVAILGDCSDVTVLDQESESLVEKELHHVGLEDVMGLQHVTEGVLDPEPVQGLSQIVEAQRSLWVRYGRIPGCGGAVHSHPLGYTAYRVDGGALPQPLAEGARPQRPQT